MAGVMGRVPRSSGGVCASRGLLPRRPTNGACVKCGPAACRTTRRPAGCRSLLLVAALFSVLSAPLAARADDPPTDRAFQAALQKIAPSIVRLDTVGGAAPVSKFEDEKTGEKITAVTFRPVEGPTTGVVWSSDGWIVTSSLNFLTQPPVTLATLGDGRRFIARLIAKDDLTRLALLKVDAADLPAPSLAPEPRPGQWALTAGWGFGSRTPALAAGVISAARRNRALTIQTDAKTSPANYGGPLFDLDGRLFGICVPQAGSADELAGVEWYDSGIGFALRCDETTRVVERLKNGVDLVGGVMGISFDPRDTAVAGSQPVGVEAVNVGSGPAADAGMQAGDLVTAIDDEPIRRPLDLDRAMARRRAGDALKVTYLRDGKSVECNVKLVTVDALAKRLEAESASQPASAPADSQPAEPPER